MKKPAQRAGTGGLSVNVSLAADIHEYAPAAPLRQDLHIARRFGVPAATAALLAELAFASPEHWRRA